MSLKLQTVPIGNYPMHPVIVSCPLCCNHVDNIAVDNIFINPLTIVVFG